MESAAPPAGAEEYFDPAGYVWFYFEKSSFVPFFAYDIPFIGLPQWLPLPYKKCAVVVNLGDGPQPLTIDVVSDNSVLFGLHGVHADGVSWLTCTLSVEAPANVHLARYIDSEWAPADKTSEVDLQFATLAYGYLLELAATRTSRSTGYSCTSTRKQPAEKSQPKSAYDWRTVVIEPKPLPGPDLGGTHASPRQHDRRGHYRKLRSGKQVWVKSCKVGKASDGVVFKDYVVRGT